MATVPKRTTTTKRSPAKQPGTADSFQNFAAKLGIGTPNLSSYSNYGLNPVTRQRAELDFIYRGSWLIGVAVDCVAEDMTVEGVEFTGDLPPEEQAILGSALVNLNFWGEVSSTIKWARLYGGAIAVMLIDGQDVETPLDVETIGEGQFKGFYVFDRWMITPEYNAVVTEVGPEIGKPLWYKPNAQTGVYQGKKIHYTRVLRVDGIELPYFQRIAENGWGLSIVERIWDRLVSFDSATAGAGQLVFKAYLRTLKVKGLRKILAAGGAAELSLTKQVENIRSLQATEGLTMVDSEDDFNTHSYSFAGLSDIIIQFGQQVSGALQVPLVRLFGQSPAGLNSSGDSDWRNYSTGIKREQNARLRAPLGRAFQVLYRSTFGKPPPDNFNFNFLDLWKLSHAEKADVATKTTASVLAGYDAGLVSAQVALRELRQSGHETGVWTNITDDDIDAADEDPPAPQDEPLTPGRSGGNEAPKDLVDTVDTFVESEHPRDPEGEFISGSGSAGTGSGKVYTAVQEKVAEAKFHQQLKERYPQGVPVYHEGPGRIGESIRQHGIRSDYGSVYASLESPSNFVHAPVKTVVKARIPLTHSHLISPDMVYNEEAPHADFLETLGGKEGAGGKAGEWKGSYISYPEAIKPEWIKEVREVEENGNSKFINPFSPSSSSLSTGMKKLNKFAIPLIRKK